LTPAMQVKGEKATSTSTRFLKPWTLRRVSIGGSRDTPYAKHEPDGKPERRAGQRECRTEVDSVVQVLGPLESIGIEEMAIRTGVPGCAA